MQVGDACDISGRPIEALDVPIVIHKVELDQEPRHAAIDLVEGQQGTCPVQAVIIGLLQGFAQQRDFLLGHVLLDAVQALIEIGYADGLVELLVEADDIDVVPVPGVNCRGTNDVVQHGIGIDVVAQEFTDMEFLVKFEEEALGVNVPGIADQRLKFIDRHGLIEIVPLNITAAQAHQVGALFIGLHALHDDRHGHGLCHVDDGLDDVHALSRVRLLHA